MMEEVYASLDELRADRHSYVQSARRNKFEDGLRSLLADLYPDNAHFIYELLQNAEDAGASVVDFVLSKNRLTVTHDGTRAFTLADIESITGIGQSTKKDDATQIGKFGVGFKAVFAYTSRPEVHSGEYAFAIQDLFVPEPVAARASQGKTVFVFPFDRKEKPASRAFEEVARGLSELSDSTVLFLSSVHTVKYRITDGRSGSVSRTERVYPRVTIKTTLNRSSQVSEWLRLVGEPGIAGVERHTVAAAFQLVEESTKSDEEVKPGAKGRASASKKKPRLVVTPVDRGDTCIFFSAAKEKSGLKFHIHAPFASTVARDSIRDTAENGALVANIGELIAAELPALVEGGWMSDGLLAALPNSNDQLVEPYNMIHFRVVEAFEQQAVTPRIRGGFAPAAELIRSPSEFRSAFTESDLKELTSLIDGDWPNEPRWIPDRDGRAGAFLGDLDAVQFGWVELGEVFRAVDYDDDGPLIQKWTDWLNDKSAKWLRGFYELIGKGFDDQTLRSRWGPGALIADFEQPLLRVRVGDGVELRSRESVYLPSTPDDASDFRVLAELAYFDSDQQSREKSRLAAFYQALEIRRWDERAAVNARLQEYAAGRYPTDDATHLTDLRQFMQFLSVHPHEQGLFDGVSIIRAEGSDGAPKWALPENVFIDEPYLRTALSALYGGLRHGPFKLSGLYRDSLDGVVEFLAKLGGKTGLSVEPANIYVNAELKSKPWWQGRSSAREVARDWWIEGLDEIVKSDRPDLLRILWLLLCESPERYRYAIYQRNASATKYRVRSQLAMAIEGVAWIPSRDGRTLSLESATSEDLPDGWGAPPPGSLALALGFGAEARARDEQVEEVAQALGVTPRMVVHLKTELEGLPDDEVEAALSDAIAILRQRRAPQAAFPTGASASPERRAALVAADAEEAPEFETEMRQRSVVKGRGVLTESAKQYLREQYTDDEGAMRCQACHGQMPFKVGEAWYFEAKQFVGKRAKQHYQNMLALCPLCAALYEYVRTTKDAHLTASLISQDITEQTGLVEVPVILDGKRVELWFTGKHALDLQAVMKVAGAER